MKPQSGNRSLHEAGHKAAWSQNDHPPHGPRRTFNEAAHKLGSWQVKPEAEPQKAGVELEAVDNERDVVAHGSKVVLALGALVAAAVASAAT